jgi:hypothetical protein
VADFTATFLSKRSPMFVAHDSMDYVAVFAPQLLDQSRPVVTVVSPAPGTQIARNAPVVVDVTDDSGTVGVVLLVRFPNFRVLEGIWDGENWGFNYTSASVKSTRVAIANGWRFTLRRDGGWPGAPTFIARGLDGNLDNG